MEQVPDVLVIGGGNAALCAAMTARRAGARVLLLESASEAERGGNSRHTRNIRYAHEFPSEHLTGPYDQEEFWSDLQRVTGGELDETLARLAIRESRDLGSWMAEHGVRWQAPLRGTLNLSRTNAFFLGGGKALINAYYAGITFTYLGVAVTERAQVVMNDGRPASNIYASGEIMAGNILGRGYLAGFGMTVGSTFGRIAGREAARDAAA